MKYLHLSKSTTTLHGPGYIHALTEFGQPVELTDEIAAEHVSHGASLLPESVVMGELGMTPEEIKKYRIQTLQDEEPDEPEKKQAHQEFLTKRDAAWQKIHEWRAKLLDNATADRPAPNPPAIPEGNVSAATLRRTAELLELASQQKENV